MISYLKRLISHLSRLLNHQGLLLKAYQGQVAPLKKELLQRKRVIHNQKDQNHMIKSLTNKIT